MSILCGCNMLLLLATERLVANNQLLGEFPVRSIAIRLQASVFLSLDGVKKLQGKDCLRVSKQILHYVRGKHLQHGQTEVSCHVFTASILSFSCITAVGF